MPWVYLASALAGLGVAALVNWGADRLPTADGGARPSLWLRQDGSLRLERHVFVTLLCAAALPALVWAIGATWATAILATWAAAFLLVAVVDFEHRLVLNRVLLAMAGGALIASAARLPGAPVLWRCLAGGAAGLGLFLLVALIGRGAMGAGDVKLAAAIGLIVGYPAVLSALFVGILFGGIAAVVVILQGKGRRATIAYAPWLSLGSVYVMLTAALQMAV
ncbi:MAG: prepilin peptidase [Anaerolineae bacterium]